MKETKQKNKKNKTVALDISRIRQSFPFFVANPDIVYLDNAATTHKCVETIDTYESLIKNNATVHRSLYALGANMTMRFDAARSKIANSIHCPTNGIIFTSGATHALNLAGHILIQHIPKKSKIVLTRLEHHSNLLIWQQVATATNSTLVFIELTKSFEIDMADAKKKIRPGVSIVAMPHISNVLGTVVDVRAICQLARSVNARTVIDGSQALGHTYVSLRDIDCDFYAASSHKACGPTGCGILACTNIALLEQSQPFFVGGDMLNSATYTSFVPKKIPARFEAGTPAYMQAIEFAESLSFLEHIGFEQIASHTKSLVAYAKDELKKVGCTIFCADSSCSIVSFTHPRLYPSDIAMLLGQKNICLRAGNHCAQPLHEYLGISHTARISFHIYNQKKDVDILINELKKL